MQKFNFSLQKVLSYQEQMLQKLTWEMGALNKELIEIDEQINTIIKKYEITNKELSEKLSKPISVMMLTSYKNYIDNLNQQIKDKENEKAIMIKLIEEKRLEILSKYKEVFGIDKLRQKELEKYNHKINKEEQSILDEFSSNKTARDRV